MPATVFMLEIKDGFDVSTRCNIFPESYRVGSFTILTIPNSKTISISLLCLAAVCWFVAHKFSRCQEGLDDRWGILKLRYRMEKDSCKASRDVV